MDDDCHKNGKESARPWLWAKMSVEYAIPGFVYGIRLCFIFPMANPPFGEFIGNIWEYVLFV